MHTACSSRGGAEAPQSAQECGLQSSGLAGQAGLEEKLRGERLSLQQLALLTDAWTQWKEEHP